MLVACDVSSTFLLVLPITYIWQRDFNFHIDGPENADLMTDATFYGLATAWRGILNKAAGDPDIAPKGPDGSSETGTVPVKAAADADTQAADID